VKSREGIAAGSLVGVGVDLQSGADPGMAQDRLHVASWHLQIFEQRPNGVAQVVDLDSPDAVVVADAAEGPDKVARLDRAAGAGREYEPGFWPCRSHIEPVGSLLGFRRTIRCQVRCDRLRQPQLALSVGSARPR